MARVPYVDPALATGRQKELCDDLVRTRGEPLEHIFLALANTPELAEGVLAMATSLRKSTILPRKFRELAVVTVGIATGAQYEVEHHWRIARKLGISQEQLTALPEYAISPLFTAEEKAVIRYALAATKGGHVSGEIWDALEFLGLEGRMELVLTTSWYNCVTRIILSLDLDLEDWLPVGEVPGDLRFDPEAG
jgi:alkylhydroperoxidase family enzyme